MGCFNVAGSLSHLSIGYDDKAIFIPLSKHRYLKEGRNLEVEPASMIVSNEGACVYYMPRFLPIIGEYNDYGSLKNIKRDANVEYIEKYFGITIEQFMEQVTRNWCNDNLKLRCHTDELEEELLGLSGMFEHYDVYEAGVKYGRATDNELLGIRLNPEGLERLGFLKEDKDTGDEGFNLYYSHPKLKDYVLYCNDSNCRLIDKKTGKEVDDAWIFRAKCLYDFLIEKGIKMSAWERHCKISIYQEPIEKGILERQKWLKAKQARASGLDAETLDENASDDEAYEFYKRRRYAVQGEEIFIQENCRHLTELSKLAYALNEECKRSLIDLLHFNSFIRSANGIYFPAASGEQHGNSYVSQVSLCNSA